MRNRYLKFQTLIILICFGFITILPADALAGPNSGPGGKSGPVFKHVPPGGRVVRYQGYNYFFYKGRCYRHGHRGYFWVHPPIGIIAYTLPVAAVAVVVRGLTYYVYENVYYKKVSAGYKVVKMPAQTITVVPPPVKPAVSGARVVVTAKTLNVRSGPGANYAVLTQTYMGQVLIVQGKAPDWYYVRLPDNTHGWVMKSFVTKPGKRPRG